MARPATGQVVVDTRRRSPSYALRFRAYGERRYVALGSAAEGWTRAKAQVELGNVLADVRRGIWKPAQPAPPPEPARDPTFHVFSSEWFAATKGEWRRSTQLDYGWQLSDHLLHYFKEHRLSQITVAEVDRYRASKVKEGRLSATSINKTITRLGQILEVAVEYGLIDRNPARGKRRRLKPQKPVPVWLDSAEQIQALLDAAGQLDREAKSNHQVPRRAMLATLVFAGLRIGELIALRWRDVDLASGRLYVRSAKTDAGVRTIDLLPVLREELTMHKAQMRPDGEGLVFATQAGTAMNPSNIRNRVLARSVARADELLKARGAAPLPENLTPHKLRHTFASLLVAVGVDPGAVMDQLGHTDPAFTLRVYRHGMRRDERSRAELRRLIGLPAVPAEGRHALGDGAGEGRERAPVPRMLDAQIPR